MVAALLRLSILLVLVTVSGCGGGPGAERAGDPTVGDTAIGVQPRSPAEIEQQAQPMTPQQAEELGVIDTTIQVTEEP
jgi:hypothetical protein